MVMPALALGRMRMGTVAEAEKGAPEDSTAVTVTGKPHWLTAKRNSLGTRQLSVVAPKSTVAGETKKEPGSPAATTSTVFAVPALLRTWNWTAPEYGSAFSATNSSRTDMRPPGG